MCLEGGHEGEQSWEAHALLRSLTPSGTQLAWSSFLENENEALWLIYIPVLLHPNAGVFLLQISGQNNPIFHSSPIKAKSSTKSPRCVLSPSRSSLKAQARWVCLTLHPGLTVVRLGALSLTTGRTLPTVKKYFPQKYLPSPEGGSSGSEKKGRKATTGGVLGVTDAFQP